MNNPKIMNGLIVALLSISSAACTDIGNAPATLVAAHASASPSVALETWASSSAPHGTPLPKLDRGTNTIGPDSNANGVRDDIEAIFAARFTDPGQRRAAFQAARAFQASLTVDTADRSATGAVSRAQMNALNCLFEKFLAGRDAPPGPRETTAASLASEIEAMTTNTKPRLKAYLKYNRALDGTVSSIPKGSTCE